MNKTIIGIFADRSDVEEAIGRLQAEGFSPKDISIVMKDRGEQEDIRHDAGTDVAEGAISGAAGGAVLGGLTGLLVGTVLPGLGGFLIGGPIGAALGLTGAAATTVSGAATGAVAGGLLGGLMGLGMNREDAQYYERQVNEGAILVAVPALTGDEAIVVDIFDRYNAQDVRTLSHEEDEYEFTPSHRDAPGSYAMGAKGGTSRKRTMRRRAR